MLNQQKYLFNILNIRHIIKQRLKWYIICQMSFLDKQLLRNVDLGVGVLNNISENSHELNTDWFLTGEGEMPKSEVAAVKKGVWC